ncbi:MAG: hypothetical protein K1X89_13140 [Myxococcaceae bacterium]|nr:hypothetical protein [Myxococcaceae bacterium]
MDTRINGRSTQALELEPAGELTASSTDTVGPARDGDRVESYQGRAQGGLFQQLGGALARRAGLDAWLEGFHEGESRTLKAEALGGHGLLGGADAKVQVRRDGEDFVVAVDDASRLGLGLGHHAGAMAAVRGGAELRFHGTQETSQFFQRLAGAGVAGAVAGAFGGSALAAGASELLSDPAYLAAHLQAAEVSSGSELRAHQDAGWAALKVEGKLHAVAELSTRVERDEGGKEWLVDRASVHVSAEALARFGAPKTPYGYSPVENVAALFAPLKGGGEVEAKATYEVRAPRFEGGKPEVLVHLEAEAKGGAALARHGAEGKLTFAVAPREAAKVQAALSVGDLSVLAGLEAQVSFRGERFTERELSTSLSAGSAVEAKFKAVSRVPEHEGAVHLERLSMAQAREAVTAMLGR